MSNAIESQGTKLRIGNTASPPVFTQVKELVSFNAFDGEAATIDVTNMDSTAREYLMGLPDFGGFTGQFNYLPKDPGHQAMRTAKQARAKRPFEFELSDGSLYTFEAFVTAAPLSGGVDAKVDGSFSLLVTGEPEFTPAA